MFSVFPTSPNHHWLINPSHHRDLVSKYLERHQAKTQAHKPKSWWWGPADSDLKELEEERALQRDAKAPGLALLEVTGVIYYGATPREEWSYGVYNLERLFSAANEVLADSTITVFAIMIESPGGYSTAVKECADLLLELRDAGKIVLFYSRTLVASAAYWLAASGTAIHAAPFCDAGSIGVYSTLVDDVEMFKKWGISVEYIRDGELKAMGGPGKGWTEKEKEFITEGVMACSKEFKGFIKANRPAVTDEQMQGQCYAANDPKAAGLVDHTTFARWEDFIVYAANVAGAMNG